MVTAQSAKESRRDAKRRLANHSIEQWSHVEPSLAKQAIHPGSDLKNFGLEMKVMSIDKLRPYQNNPRSHPSKSIQGIASSIEAFGFKNIVMIDRDFEIIFGHGRIEAAKQLGIKQVPVLIATDLDKTQARALRIADNQIALLSEWNELNLKTEILQLKEVGMDLQALGFSDKELARYSTDDGLGQDPGAGAPPKHPVTQRGDIWVLGEHRLMCGDSTNEVDVEELLAGEKIDLCLTDPPYCVDYENQKRSMEHRTRKSKGDAYKDPLEPENLLKFINLVTSDILVMTFPINKHFHLLSDMTREWELLYDCVWVKNHFAYIMGRRYQPRHEPILIFRRAKHKSAGTWNVPETQSTIFEYDKPSVSDDHPTMKPLELWRKLVELQSDKSQTIYDPFGGSGTTLIACEHLNRRCLMMEIQPGYCDVIINRWQGATGKSAVLEK
jgi:DNA modification methylase